MKRQISVVGPTPEFVRWSIRQLCEFRADTDITSVDETEKRLRAIRAAGLAIGQRRVMDDVAVDVEAGKGFRLSEVCGLWGGAEHIETVCQNCPANVLDESESGRWAGCYGWLRRDQLGESFVEYLDDAWRELQPIEPRLSRFPQTRPQWYGLWMAGQLVSWELGVVNRLLQSVQLRLTHLSPAVESFCRVLQRCSSRNLTVDVELMPSGFSDGDAWTIDRHCQRCRGPMTTSSKGCGVCGQSGQGHPPIKRRVLGSRPYVDLEVVLGPEQATTFVSKFKQQKS